jgi:autotransporter-associated beta strand protein
LDLTNGELGIGGANANAAFSGIISGAGPLTKVGTGVQTFSGNNTYLGNTTVSNGTLLVNGQQPASPVFVRSGATLGGSGTVGRIIVASGGTLSPGNSPGIITPSGFVTFADSNSLFRVELNGLMPGPGHDQLNAPFAVSLANATLEVTLGFTPAVSNHFTIINKAGVSQVSGTFKDLPEGAVFSADGATFQITYAGGDGNDVVLTFLSLAAPEFASIMITSTNTLVLQAQGAPNTSYVLQATPHLNPPIPWSPIATNSTDGAGLFQFIDVDWMNFATRFYRLSKP